MNCHAALVSASQIIYRDPKQVRDDTESRDDMASRDDTGSRNGITQKTEMTHPDMLCLCLED